MRPIIGITPNSICHEPWAPLQNGQNDTYVRAVLLAGGVPVILPLIDDEEVLRELYDLLDGIILAGGENIASPPSARDRMERLLVTWASEDGKPLLGTCRGMQVINWVRGGGLPEDITAAAYPEMLDHGASEKAQDISHIAHRMHLAPESRLYKLLGPDPDINEYHGQAIVYVGEGLDVVGWTSDGVPEALEGTNAETFVFGVQCHPESLVVGGTAMVWWPLFTGLIAASAKWRDAGMAIRPRLAS
ncbi:MAG: peptidase [Patescibacteria group bacterium]|nr:peptidase [Patescibacteria group bacterium]